MKLTKNLQPSSEKFFKSKQLILILRLKIMLPVSHVFFEIIWQKIEFFVNIWFKQKKLLRLKEEKNTNSVLRLYGEI